MEESLCALGICETWLVESMPSSFVEIPGYSFFRQDVVGSVRKHGVGLYLRACDGAVAVEVDVPNVLIVQASSWDMFIVVVYRPPSNSLTDNEELSRFLIDFCCSRNVVVLGDFNLPSLKWSTDHVLPDGYIPRIDRLFFESFLEAGLVQIVEDPTFVSSGNILDLILVSNHEMVGDVSVGAPLPRCHHCPVLADLYLSTSVTSVEKYVRLWSKGNYAAISRELGGVGWESLFEGRSLDECYNLFISVCSELVDMYVPLKQYRESPGWKSRPPRSLLRRRSLSWKKYCRVRGVLGRNHPHAVLAWEEYCHLNVEYRNYSVNKQKDYELDLVMNINQRPKLFHSYLRRKKKGKPPVGPLRCDGRLVSDPQAMSNVLVEYFSSVFSTVSSLTVGNHQVCERSMGDLHISIQDVDLALSKLNVSSAPGGDGVHPQFLKSCSDVVAYPLLLIFVRSLRSGQLPMAWKSSVIVPLFKSGSRCSPSNYRPVSLTSICCKTMERIVVKHIEHFLESNDLLADRQFGFRKGRSTEDQLLLFYGEISRLVDGGSSVEVVYLDFSKAFDLVSHQILLEKLAALGFDEHVMGWIRDFMTGRSMSVLVAGEESQEEEVTSGVPQGSVLGPLLFLVYVNWITRDVVGNWAAFADDFKVSVCYPRGDSVEMRGGVEQLQSDLDSIARASSSWNLRLNPAKCVVMRYGCRGGMEHHYTVQDSTIQQVHKYRDLGVIVDSTLRFHSHIDCIVGRTGSMINNLLRSTLCRSVDFMVTLWVSHVRPLIEFNSCVWNVGYLRDLGRLESLQRRWTREGEGMVNVNYPERLKRIGLFSVRGRLLRLDLMKVWKCFNSDLDLGLCELFERARNSSTRGHRLKLAIPVCRTDLRRRSFGVRCVRLWNSLPSTLVESGRDAFKQGLDSFLGDELYLPA